MTTYTNLSRSSGSYSNLSKSTASYLNYVRRGVNAIISQIDRTFEDVALVDDTLLQNTTFDQLSEQTYTNQTKST